MKVLVVGGNRFVGYELAARLLAGGHEVTLFNRGRLPSPLGSRVEWLRGDRTGGNAQPPGDPQRNAAAQPR